MITIGALKALEHLAKMGHTPLATKIFKALTTGKTAHFKNKKELDAFYAVKGNLTGPKVYKDNIIGFGDDGNVGRFLLEREAGLGAGSKYGSYGRNYYGLQKNVPITDVDLLDPTSHKKEQVIFNTLAEFTPALKDFMKTKRGKQTAFKIYRTPAGMRLFDVSKISRKEKTDYYGEVWDALGVDPYFQSGALKSGTYNTRLHPKPGRKTNVWNLPGNVTTGKFAKENPGDFVAKQKTPGSIIKGPDAVVDPRSLAEVNLYHDMLIRGILERKAKREGRTPGLEGLISLLREYK